MLSLVKSLITGTPHSLLFWLISPDGELFIVPPSPRFPTWLSGCLAEGKYTIPMFTVHDWELLLRWDLLSSLQGQGLFLKQLLPLSEGVSLLTTCNSLQLEPDLSVQRAVGELRGEATTSSAELDFPEYLADSGNLQATCLGRFRAWCHCVANIKFPRLLWICFPLGCWLCRSSMGGAPTAAAERYCQWTAGGFVYLFVCVCTYVVSESSPDRMCSQPMEF